MGNAYFLVSDKTKCINISSDYLVQDYLVDNSQLYKVLDSSDLRAIFLSVEGFLLKELANYKDAHPGRGYYKEYIYKDVKVNLNLRGIEGVKLAARIGVVELTETIINQNERLYILNRTLLNNNAREELLKTLKKLERASIEAIKTEINTLSNIYSSVSKIDVNEVMSSLNYLIKNDLVELRKANMYSLTFIGDLFASRHFS
ncbi:hypothetical protein [Chitinophaga rhizophila]|uniref:Uncharacterized protein n=1 Tax=Chitinophaga rhizophila TaxID=2866212 RepID=A0ABS7GH14_9BACT|nr:hypothetical protein [Chitinophaga rhizophila]MBW8686982.1 hypothetical protein [Chitinophaga rhizophila]